MENVYNDFIKCFGEKEGDELFWEVFSLACEFFGGNLPDNLFSSGRGMLESGFSWATYLHDRELKEWVRIHERLLNV